MPRIPAIIMGTMDFMIMSGFKTPIEAMQIPDFAVPYAAPKSKFTIVSRKEVITSHAEGEGNTQVSEESAGSCSLFKAHFLYDILI